MYIFKRFDMKRLKITIKVECEDDFYNKNVKDLIDDIKSKTLQKDMLSNKGVEKVKIEYMLTDR